MDTYKVAYFIPINLKKIVSFSYDEIRKQIILGFENGINLFLDLSNEESCFSINFQMKGKEKKYRAFDFSYDGEISSRTPF